MSDLGAPAQRADADLDRVLDAILARNYAWLDDWIEAPGLTFRAVFAEARRARAEVALLKAALRRYTDLIDLPANEYTDRYGATTYGDAVNDFVREARAVMGEDTHA